jgi:hypothetical protein
MEDERPPAPLSVMNRYSPLSRALMRKSNIRFWVMGSPICTAVTGEFSFSSSEEKVAPWIPSLPIRPPVMTMISPGSMDFSWDGSPLILAGMIPAVPQKTSGLPQNRSSKTNEPFTVGIPLLLPPCSTPSTTPS